ncbi:aminoglycoside phosphotransferase family protein [bacterium]|nr:aminoglycoside phosphotransferase family protein [bacterium]
MVKILEQFDLVTDEESISEISDGNINDTYLIDHVSSPGNQQKYVLQRINHKVFPKPSLVARNMKIVLDHIQQELKDRPFRFRGRVEFPFMVPTSTGEYAHEDKQGNFWRLLTFIENTKTFQQIESTHQARETGFALGMFHTLIKDINPQNLSDTLKGFHITPNYLKHFDNVIKKTSKNLKNLQVLTCIEFIEKRRELVCKLENGRKNHTLTLLPIHGDPKINNILFDADTELAVCMIDFDTVKPGLILYDIADCLRSSCNPAGEEAESPESACFDLDIMHTILQSYLETSENLMNDEDYAMLFDATRIMTLELGLRFFTDYLEGNVYFKTKTEDHNLRRALLQFCLCRSIESREAGFKSMIEDLRS